VKIKNKLGIKVLSLVVFSLLLAVNCAEKGTAPEANIPPNTFITNFQIDVTPSLGTDYNTRVYWKGNDEDGAVFWYYWRIIGDAQDSQFVYVESSEEPGVVDTVNLSTWQVTPSLSAELTLDFPTFDKKYIFEVMAQDDDRADDPTPAIDTIGVSRIRDFNYLPSTTIVTGPPNGAVTGQGIFFEIKGTDIDGAVDTIAYMLDTDTEWTYAATDITTGILAFALRDIPLGARTITFTAFDNFRACDPTPASVSVVVVDSFEPELAISVMPDQAFIVPFTDPIIAELPITITGTVDFYYSAIDSFVIISSAGDTINTSDPSYTFENLGSGNYWVNVTAYDIGGGITSTGDVNFSIAELPAGDGLLCVNGVDWGTYGQAAVMWDDGVPWGNREHFKCWDLFDTTPFGAVPDFADSLLGAGSIPEWMFDTTFFDAISWFGNNYSGDIAFWDERHDAIMAYLEMGGNLLLPTRYGSTFFFDDLATYAGIVAGSWVSPGADVLVAKVGILDNILEETGQSLWEIPMTNNSDNVWIYEAANVAAGLHAGFVTLPNGEGGGGAFCYIAGRSYRWDNPSLKAAVDVIMETYFGIEN